MRLLVLLATTTLLLAGCGAPAAQEDDASSTADADGTASASSGASTSGTAKASTSGKPASASPNRAPSITVFGANVTSGSAPLVVAFNFSASDPDGQPLSYTLAFGDGSSNATGILPAQAVGHLFAAAGNYTVRLQVSDGALAANRTLSILVLAPVSAAEPVVLDGTVLAPDPFAVVPGGFCVNDLFLQTGTAGTLGEWHDMDAYQGWSYALSAGVLATFWPNLPSGTSGTVPADADFVVICGNAPTSVNLDYTLTLTPA